MKVHKLAIWFLLPMLAGCTRLTQQPTTPPSGLSAQQKAEWSTSKCVRLVKEKRPWDHKIFPCRCAYRDYYVMIISPDGTALASFRDATDRPGSAYNESPKAAKEIYTQRALDRRYLLQAANGGRYLYRVTALAADCESAILKPVKQVPPQPYLDISRLEIVKPGQSYRGVISPVYARQELPIRLGAVKLHSQLKQAVTMSIHLLFRESDGSFAGFAQPTETGFAAETNLKPLQKFIETNSTVRFVKP